MTLVKKVPAVFLVLMLASLLAVPAYAADAAGEPPAAGVEEVQEAGENSNIGLKAVAVGLAIGLAAAGGAVGMGIVGGKAADGISRQPEMEGKIRTTLMLDLVFIETAIIYALLVVILVIFVL